MDNTRTVAVNERGQRVGQDHQRAKLTDREVELMRSMHEDEGVGYRRLMKIFQVSKSAVRKICNYKMRCQTVAGFRHVVKP